MGGVIRRLASKCACNVVKEKASDFLVHFSLVWLVLEDQERSSENSIGVTLIMLSLKLIGRMLSILYLHMLCFSSFLHFQRFTHGPAGATHNTQNFGILLV